MSAFRRMATAFVAVAALTAPASAQANSPSSQEPVLTLSGAMLNCLPDGSMAQGLSQILTNPPLAWEAQYGIKKLPQEMVRAWLPTSQDVDPYGYDQCGGSAFVIADRLYHKLVRYKNRLNDPNQNLAKKNYGVTKIDIYAVSYGTLIARLCVTTVEGCAELVDDLVMAVPPSHGSTASSNVNCNGLPYYHICMAIKPGSTAITQMNAGDETPHGEGDPNGWIEYTTLRAQADGLIYPSGSEKLSGAANWLMTVPGATQPTNHADWGGAGANCQGRTDYKPSGFAESIAFEMLDRTDRSSWLPTATSVFDNPLSCNNVIN